MGNIGTGSVMCGKVFMRVAEEKIAEVRHWPIIICINLNLITPWLILRSRYFKF